MNPLAVLTLITGQKERVVWALIALGLLLWVWDTASEVGSLKTKVEYQAEALEHVSRQLNECLEARHGAD